MTIDLLAAARRVERVCRADELGLTPELSSALDELEERYTQLIADTPGDHDEWPHSLVEAWFKLLVCARQLARHGVEPARTLESRVRTVLQVPGADALATLDTNQRRRAGDPTWPS